MIRLPDNVGLSLVIAILITILMIIFRRLNIFSHLSDILSQGGRYPRHSDYDGRHFSDRRVPPKPKINRRRESSSADEANDSPAYSPSLADGCNGGPNRVLNQRLAVDRDIVDIILEDNIDTSRYIRKDINELMTVRKGVMPNQLKSTLEGIIKQYQHNSQQYLAIEAIINELKEAQVDNNLTGQCHMEQIAATSTTGSLTATFIAYQYRRDAIIITSNQKLNVQWAHMGVDLATAGIIGCLINPAVGLSELVGGLSSVFLLAKELSDVRAATTDKNAKAVLFKMLMDRGLAKIEKRQLYLTIE